MEIADVIGYLQTIHCMLNPFVMFPTYFVCRMWLPTKSYAAGNSCVRCAPTLFLNPTPPRRSPAPLRTHSIRAQVLKIGSLKKSMTFFENVLGLKVLRHEEFDEGCEATCNGPYGGEHGG